MDERMNLRLVNGRFRATGWVPGFRGRHMREIRHAPNVVAGIVVSVRAHGERAVIPFTGHW